MIVSEKTTTYENSLKENNSHCNQAKYENKKQSELNHPNYEARKQQVPEYYQVGKQSLIPTSKFFIPRNPNFFYGYCFSCGNFGHRAISSRFIRYNKSIGNRFKKPQKAMVQSSSNNSFSPLLNDHECHI